MIDMIDSKNVGNIILSTAGPREVMRFEANGDVYVGGEKVDSNKEIYEAFKAWLAESRAYLNRAVR